jgi:hypothetical protein
VNCFYWMILCFILLDNRRYQHECRSVRRCNERLVVRYTTCSMYGRRELVGDVYFGSAVFGATYCDPLNELFDQFAPIMPRLVCVHFECLQGAAQGREPRGRAVMSCPWRPTARSTGATSAA